MNNTLPRLLLVDDDTELLNLLQEYLEGDGFIVHCASNGVEALLCLRDNPDIAAIVLDIMMPGQSGLELLKQLRQSSSIPILMLTGRGDDIDRIIGLELGADDYMGKPCNPRELSARIRAVLRRTTHQAPIIANPILQIGELTLDESRLKATALGQTINLTSTEFRTLFLLGQNLGTPLSKEDLTEQILHRKLSPYDRSMDVHISRIRQKLADLPQLQLSIQSVRNVGYQLLIDEQTAQRS